MQKNEVIKRYMVFFLGQLVIALGIAILAKENLGTSPLSSVPYVLNKRFPTFPKTAIESYGYFTFFWNALMLLTQIIILRKDFKKIQLFQLPLTLVLSFFINLWLKVFSFYTPNGYLEELLLVIAGCIVSALGIVLTVVPNVVMSSGEALTVVLANKLNRNLGFIKVAFDCVLVVVAAILCKAMFGNVLEYVREGTLINAVFTGVFINFFMSLIKKPLEKFMT
ncbi:MAG: DUF6198 family protein [Bacillota bacterium]|nr:DUF6198 family protein [Bacillota bacterium]